MHTVLYKKHIITILLFTLLLFASTWSSSSAQHLKANNSLWQNSKINVEFSFGRAFIESDAFFSVKKDPTKDEYSAIRATISTNYSINILAGYNFDFSLNRKLGFETGIGYGFPIRLELKEVGIIFQENHIKIPFLITIVEKYKTSFYLAQTMMLGYEFNVILNPVYKQVGSYPGLHTSMQGNKNIQKSMPDFSRLSGSVILGTRFNFPKGLYVAANLKIPIEIFKNIFGPFDKNSTHFNSYFVDEVRRDYKSCFTFHLGIDIIDWIFPKTGIENIHDKTSI
jgi:hypothetical protein